MPLPLPAFFLLLLTAVAAQAAVAPAPASYPRDAATLMQGQALFTQYCASCHALDRDTMGPPLGGVTQVLSGDELRQQISNATAVVESGNPRANALFRRYKIVMPPFAALPAEQVTAILAYIDAESERAKLKPFAVNLTPPSAQTPRLIPPVEKSGLVIELEDYVQIPLAANRRPDKGIATLRSSPQKDGAFFVSDQMGVIYRVQNRQVSVYLDTRDKLPDFVFEPGIGTGLGSFSFHPDFLRNGLLYTTHAELTPEKKAINDDWYEKVTIPFQGTPTLHWVVSEWKIADPKADHFTGTRREVLRFKTPTTAHGSQDLAFAPVDPKDPDYGLIFLGVGDGGSVNLKMPQLAHNPRSLLGTVLRIDPRGTNAPAGTYGIPADNPFAHSTDPLARPEIWAYGFRNPHRMSWDVSYGKKRLIVADIGESNVEEVNLIEKGGDYGWNKVEGPTKVDVLRDAKVNFAAQPADLAPYKMPHGMFDHTDGNAISGGFVYAGPLEALQHKYVFGDIVTGRLFFMNFDATLSDSKVYELNIVRNGAATTIGAFSKAKRAHLRIGYDEVTRDLYIMTKEDGRIRRVIKAYTR